MSASCRARIGHARRARHIAISFIQEFIMKPLIRVAIVALAISPIAALAQTNEPVTRAEVRAELVQLENAGYNPSVKDPYYPRDIQAAEARVQADNGSSAAYGPSAEGTSGAGQPARTGTSE
jgi:hypothetical protein